MDIVTPTEITRIAWEGELIAPSVHRGTLSPAKRPIVVIGQPEIWKAADAVKPEVGKEWTPPLGGAEFWLIRLACTLRRSGSEIAEAVQTLYLRPRQAGADPNAAYAYSLYPDRLGVEDNTEITIGLKPELKFTGAEAKGGELGAKIVCHRVFPVIQSYNAGTPTPYWAFRSHLAYPLEGTQFVYAVVAARPGSNGARASIELVVTAQTQLGSLRFGLPEEARAHTSFTIP